MEYSQEEQNKKESKRILKIVGTVILIMILFAATIFYLANV